MLGLRQVDRVLHGPNNTRKGKKKKSRIKAVFVGGSGSRGGVIVLTFTIKTGSDLSSRNFDPEGFVLVTALQPI